jgi:hypothetical protein
MLAQCMNESKLKDMVNSLILEKQITMRNFLVVGAKDETISSLDLFRMRC